MKIFNLELGNTDELKQFIPANKNMALQSFVPYWPMATKFIQELGVTDALVTKIEAIYLQASPTADDAALLYKTQSAFAWYLYYRIIPFNSIQVSDSGNSVAIPGDVIASSEKSQKDLEFNALRTSLDMLEDLIFNFLLPKSGDYTDFDKTKAVQFFINSPETILKHQDIYQNGKLETWKALRPYMDKIETLFIRKILCNDLFEELKTKQAAAVSGGTALTDVWQQLLNKVQAVVSEYAWEMATPLLGNKLTARGSKQKSQYDETDGAGNKHKDLEYLNLAVQRFKSLSIKDLYDFLESNTDTFTTWAESKCNPNNEEETCSTDKCKEISVNIANCGGTVAL